MMILDDPTLPLDDPRSVYTRGRIERCKMARFYRAMNRVSQANVKLAKKLGLFAGGRATCSEEFLDGYYDVKIRRIRVTLPSNS
jgi:hypothetical protein